MSDGSQEQTSEADQTFVGSSDSHSVHSANINTDHGVDSSAMSDTPKPLPEKFGRYAIDRKLGAGAMGTVYLARDTQLDRLVALKVPRFPEENRELAIKRFYREARSMATLQHPNLCPVYDVGEIDGITYMSMAFIEGGTLEDHVRNHGRFANDELAAMIRKLAMAMQDAHQAGILHRDLKPVNIMIDKRGEPVIMDFGLALRDKEGDASLTQVGTVMGTPSYMSPEQLRGVPEDIGPACDVYSLGVVSYELLCGALPFTGSLSVVLGKILMDEPTPPSKIDKQIDQKLEAICLKSMAKDVKERYQSAGELAAALGKYLRTYGEALVSPDAAEFGVEIVIAEDSSAQAIFLKQGLEEHGFQVRRGKNGKEALKLIREQKPTLVISDVEMPVMDGYELCRMIKGDDELNDIPVILLSTLSNPEDVVQGLRVGADNYVTKPYEIPFILSRIDSILSAPRTGKSEAPPEELDVTVAGKSYTIMSDGQQTLDLLVSTFENAVQKNSELIEVRQQLTSLQEELKRKTAQLNESTLVTQELSEELKRLHGE